MKPMIKVLVDTNVLIYSIDEESRYFEKSHNLMLNDEIELFTTSKNLSEFLAVITRVPHNLLTIEEALVVAKEFTSLCNILYPSPGSYSLFKNLLLKYKPTGLKIHDFEIISIGLAHNINSIATINVKDFDEISEINFYNL